MRRPLGGCGERALRRGRRSGGHGGARGAASRRASSCAVIGSSGVAKRRGERHVRDCEVLQRARRRVRTARVEHERVHL